MFVGRCCRENKVTYSCTKTTTHVCIKTKMHTHHTPHKHDHIFVHHDDMATDDVYFSPFSQQHFITTALYCIQESSGERWHYVGVSLEEIGKDKVQQTFTGIVHLATHLGGIFSASVRYIFDRRCFKYHEPDTIKTTF
jgi:hypothetical protein